MRKFKTVLFVISLLTAIPVFPANAYVKPIVESFTFSPTDIELTGVSTKVIFELVVSHPFGIENSKSDVTLKSSKGNSLVVSLIRTDSPINYGKSRVTFVGSIELPRDLLAGVYNLSASSLKNNASAGYQYETGEIFSTKIRDLRGAENGLIVRNFGKINLSFETFVGPSYDNSLNLTFENKMKFNSNNIPIFKVGETFDPTDYFETRVPNLPLKITSSNSSVCTSDGKLMKFIAQGNCTFTVLTDATNEYLEKSLTLSANITSARIKPEINLEKLPNQAAIDLPKSIRIVPVFGPLGTYILPKSETPTVCTASLLFVQITSGGTCTLSYQTPETSEFRASDVYMQTFEIVRSTQTLDFALPLSTQLKNKSIPLSALASSGARVTFTAEPLSNCKVIGDTLTLTRPGKCAVTASQTGNATIAPITKTIEISITGKAQRTQITISCVKDAKKIDVTRVNPKCPKGYSRVR